MAACWRARDVSATPVNLGRIGEQEPRTRKKDAHQPVKHCVWAIWRSEVIFFYRYYNTKAIWKAVFQLPQRAQYRDYRNAAADPRQAYTLFSSRIQQSIHHLIAKTQKWGTSSD